MATPLFKNGGAAKFCYIDDVGSWSTNEITVNWNASLSWVSSFRRPRPIGHLDQAPDPPPQAGSCRDVQPSWTITIRDEDYVGAMLLTFHSMLRFEVGGQPW